MLSVRERTFLTMAQVAAGNSTYRHRLGAVIVAGGRVRGVGWSKRRNVPRNMSEAHLHRCSIHAEIDALRGLTDMRRATCYVARILRGTGEPALAKPCVSCWDALATAGVTTVYWTTAQTYGVSRLN